MFKLFQLLANAEPATDQAYQTATVWWDELWPLLIKEGFKSVRELPRVILTCPVSQPELYLTTAYVSLLSHPNLGDVDTTQLYQDLLQFIIDSKEMDNDWKNYARTVRRMLKTYNEYMPSMPEVDYKEIMSISWDELFNANEDELIANIEKKLRNIDPSLN